MNTRIASNQSEPKINGYTYQLYILQGVLLALLSFPGMVNVITMTQPVQGFTELWATLLWCGFLLIRFQPEAERQNLRRSNIKPASKRFTLFLALLGVVVFAMLPHAKHYLGALVGSLLTLRLYTQDPQSQVTKVAAFMAGMITLGSLAMGYFGYRHLLLEFTYLALSIPYFTIAARLAWRRESYSPIPDRAAS